MPPTVVGQIDDIRHRALTQRIELAFIGSQAVAVLDARVAILDDLSRAMEAAGASTADIDELITQWRLGDIDRCTDLLAAIHHLIGDCLGL
jgi:hypothetical protein